MRSVLLIALLIPLLFTLGCGQRTARKPAAKPTETAAAPQPAPPPPAGVAEKNTPTNPKTPNDADDEPNWLKPTPRPEPTVAPGGSGKVPWGIIPPDGGWNNPNPSIPPMPQPAPLPQPPPNSPPQPRPQPPAVGPAKPPPQPLPQPPPGMGRLDPQPQPASPPAKPPSVDPTELPVVTEADMKEVWIFIENASLASGRMPPPVLTYTALVEAKSKAAPLVKAGSIYLTGSPQRESIWAFDFRAFSRGEPVLVATHNGVETLTVEQLKARLGAK
ncbi:MAG: hypothetical protein RMJ56_11170 [Gemmataceae bacterium]|nr:hypothetical protein [Gemmata sp.]MDW8198151.1 hypothetical protein [Gemmataceae bacterium]